MFQHMTVPNIALSFHIKTFKQTAIILGEFHSQNSHIIRMSVNCVSEHLFELFRVLIISNSELFRIDADWSFRESMFWWHSSILLKVSFSVFLNAYGELLDFLDVNEVEMNGMCVRSEIDDVKIISLSNIVCAVGTTHTVHHWNSINKHGINITIFIGNLKQSWKYFFSLFKKWILLLFGH